MIVSCVAWQVKNDVVEFLQVGARVDAATISKANNIFQLRKIRVTKTKWTPGTEKTCFTFSRRSRAKGGLQRSSSSTINISGATLASPLLCEDGARVAASSDNAFRKPSMLFFSLPCWEISASIYSSVLVPASSAMSSATDANCSKSAASRAPNVAALTPILAPLRNSTRPARLAIFRNRLCADVLDFFFCNDRSIILPAIAIKASSI